MRIKCIAGPLHDTYVDHPEPLPRRIIAPKFNDGVPFRPVVGKWDDPTYIPRPDLHEYELQRRPSEVVYVLKTIHRSDGTRL